MANHNIKLTLKEDMTKSEKTPRPPAIEIYLHCAKCVEMRPIDEPWAQYSRISAGMTPVGLQIWCERHNQSIAHFDFERHALKYVNENFN